MFRFIMHLVLRFFVLQIPKEQNRNGKIEVSVSGDPNGIRETIDLINGHLTGDRPFRPPRDDYGGGGYGGGREY